jgi:RNA polymerase sigma factor (sigma-70 family)
MAALTVEQRELAAGYARKAAAISRAVAWGWNVIHWLDDLRGVAFVALSKAAQRYDAGKAKFPTYAWRRVTGACLNAAEKEHRRIQREPLLDVSEDIRDDGQPADENEAIDRIDDAAAGVMDAFAVACAAVAGADVELLRERTRADLERALGALRPEDRRLFELRHRDGSTWRAAAEGLGISEGTAKDRDQRIRAALRKALRGVAGSR